MNHVKFTKNKYGYYEIGEYTNEHHLLTLALILTDSTHINSANDILSNNKLDEVCGNLYCIIRNENKIGIEYIYSKSDYDDTWFLDEETFAYLINTWETLNKLDVKEIILSYNDGKYEMTGK